MSGTRRKPGALGQHVNGYRSYLLALGYTPETVRGQLKALGQLGRWMAARGLMPAELSLARVKEFLADRRADQFRQAPYRRGMVMLLEYLIAEDVVVADDLPARTALEDLVDAYHEWLVDDRGLAATTVLRYEKTARRFLQQSGRVEAVNVAGLTGAEVSAFLLAECARCSVGAAKGRVAELRSLLRYLYLRGLTPLPLAAAVPPVAGWHDTGIPPTLSAADVAVLLDSCDRSTPVGTRDFAIMSLLARLGLRSIEVARLELDDVDWRRGEVVIRGKARRRDRLPLPVKVGEALAAYLADARPATRCRQLFVTCRAPRRSIRADLVGDVVERACHRAGLPTVGAHRLRHALASELLAQGATLSDISQVLRHRDLATTAIYAKVDLASLRAVARPWPGETR
jgi:site-specific recombinase XerD